MYLSLDSRSFKKISWWYWKCLKCHNCSTGKGIKRTSRIFMLQEPIPLSSSHFRLNNNPKSEWQYGKIFHVKENLCIWVFDITVWIFKRKRKRFFRIVSNCGEDFWNVYYYSIQFINILLIFITNWKNGLLIRKSIRIFLNT